jgi:hypothetical protein
MHSRLASQTFGTQLPAAPRRAAAATRALQTAKPPFRGQRPRRRRAMHAVADLRATLDTLVTTGAVAVGVGVTLLAIFADPRPKAKVKEEQDNSFKWGLMGGISCLPLFNWMVSARTLRWRCHLHAHIWDQVQRAGSSACKRAGERGVPFSCWRATCAAPRPAGGRHAAQGA